MPAQQYCDRSGNAVTADEALDAAGHLRNGFGLRVPLSSVRQLTAKHSRGQQASQQNTRPRSYGQEDGELRGGGRRGTTPPQQV